MFRERLEKLETYFLTVIEDRRQGFLPSFLQGLLKYLSFLYASIMQVRLWLFEHGIFRHHTLGCQVISIGNLTFGGTGKTPIVEVFARALQKKGRKVAILSRGYKKTEPTLGEKLRGMVSFSKNAHPPRLVSDGKRLLLDSEMSGDEPFMLASNLPEVCVLVDKNRVKAGRYAIQKLGCDTLILDDGFQYLAMKHRMDIVLVDRTNPFGNGYVLPRGILRESYRNIRRASFIFITKSKGDGSAELKKQLRTLNPDAEIAECRHCPKFFQDVYTGERKPLQFVQGLDIAAISGIAVPKGFEDELVRLGGRLLYHKRFTDHHRYTQQEIIDMINKSIQRGAKAIVTTEKDAVRFPKIARRDIPIYYLRVEIELLSGAEDFYDCISRICFH